MFAMSAKLNPYINFKGNAREAMEFYKSILGGELTMQTFGEAGAMDHGENKDEIMHADLKNGDLSFMASDAGAHPISEGSNISMSLSGDDDVKLTEYYNKLSEGGKIDQPLETAPWGDKFGMFTDKFGLHWMVNIARNQGEQK